MNDTIRLDTSVTTNTITPHEFHPGWILLRGMCLGFVGGVFCTNYYHAKLRQRQDYSYVPEIETTQQYPWTWWNQHCPMR
jgi:hypothetical protein